MTNNSGIYKVTSPSGRVYIGQSINIKKRFYNYSVMNCSGQTKLYNSFKKYGVDKHVFEIIEYCDADIINERERFYQEKFNVIHPKKGLNCCLTETNEKKYVFSEESIQKMSAWQKGVPKSKEHRKKISESKRGVKQTLEHRLKAAKTRIGSKRTKKQKERISESLKGKNGKLVFDIKSFVFYECLKEVSYLYEINYSTLKARLNGRMVNNTNFIYI